MDYSNIRIVNQHLDPALGWTTIVYKFHHRHLDRHLVDQEQGVIKFHRHLDHHLVDQEWEIIRGHHHRHHLALPLKKIKVKLVLLPLTQEASEDVCIAGFIFGHLVQIEDFGYI